MNKTIKYGLITCGLLLLAFIPESLIFQNHMPVCIFKYLSGIDCPLCGMTRASFNIMHLQLSSAFGYNPVSLMLPVILITEIINDIFPSVRSGKFRRAVLILFVVSLAALFLVRVIHYFLK